MQSSFLLSEWPLLTQEHFLQLPYCLIVDSATLSNACSPILSDGKEKRKNWSLLSSLPFPPQNLSLRTAHHALYFKVDLRACSSAFIHSFVHSANN